MKRKALFLIALIVIINLVGCNNVTKSSKFDNSSINKEHIDSSSNKKYLLEQVVILSRHNIRSPLTNNDSIFGTITPHKWFEWTSNPSELSIKGGILETEFGQYFRNYLEEEGLFEENYKPKKDEVRIYANAKQRTIATAKYFSAGLLPISNTNVEFHGEYDAMDPVFNPSLTYVSDTYIDKSLKQIDEFFRDDIKNLNKNYELLSDVIDLQDSKAYKDNTLTGFNTSDTKITLEKDKEPSMEGSLKTACSVSDALVLQYFEQDANSNNIFDKNLTQQEWIDIANIKSTYNKVLFTAPLVAYNVANPLLKEINSEMNNSKRKFSYLCGHDSNIISVLTALQAQEYNLDDTIEKEAPIGSKLVFTKWKSRDNEYYWDIDLIYQTTKQIKGIEMLTNDNKPASTDIKIKGLSENKDSLYKSKDISNRFNKAIKEYNNLMKE